MLIIRKVLWDSAVLLRSGEKKYNPHVLSLLFGGMDSC